MEKRITKCGWCSKKILRYPINHNTGKPILFSFCDDRCKGDWQRENLKPSGVNKKWLIKKYLIENLDCAEIGRLVNRDTKRVWEWLRDYGIETRPRGSSLSKQWKNGLRENTFWSGKKHKESSKNKIREARIRDGRVPYLMPDGSHYMKGRRGKDHHSWRGGLTPEREKIIRTDEWIALVKKVWKRDNAKCQRCEKHHNTEKSRGTFHIHHIVSFQVREKRMVLSNLVLLCKDCHRWVHSKKNVNKLYIKQWSKK